MEIDLCYSIYCKIVVIKIDYVEILIFIYMSLKG